MKRHRQQINSNPPAEAYMMYSQVMPYPKISKTAVSSDVSATAALSTKLGDKLGTLEGISLGCIVGSISPSISTGPQIGFAKFGSWTHPLDRMSTAKSTSLVGPVTVTMIDPHATVGMTMAPRSERYDLKSRAMNSKQLDTS